MLILDHPSQLKPLNLPHIICTVGVFDGVHLGHQKIISTLVKTAKECGGTSVVITFDKHPYNVLNPTVHLPLLTSMEHKLMLIDSLGIDVCIMMKFNEAVADTPAETWIKEVLWKEMHIEAIFLGEDSFFGKDGKGDHELLSQWGKQLGFRVIKMEMLRIEKIPVSSTIIRNSITGGDLTSAKKFLGRPYSVLGVPVRGIGRGKELGFPTINLDTQDQCLPPNGVYAVWANTAPAVANLGIRPTFKTTAGNPILEVHLLSNQERCARSDLAFREVRPRTSNNIEVIFIEKIRDEMCFTGAKELASQIERDINKAKELFSV